LHSRISDLRKKGHNVEGRHVPGRSGADGYEYRLLSSVAFVDVPKVRREAYILPLEAAAPPVEQLSELAAAALTKEQMDAAARGFVQLTLHGTPVERPVGPDHYDI
jgi:hypothetical protein